MTKLRQNKIEEFEKHFRIKENLDNPIIINFNIVIEDQKRWLQQTLEEVEREAYERAQKAVENLYQYKGHTDHDDKDEWYDCVKCMEDVNYDGVIKALDELKEKTE